MSRPALKRIDITGLVLAGGRGSRMGGLDKGLQKYRDVPLALHSLHRLQQQLDRVMINANRDLAIYRSFGVPVVSDSAHGCDERQPTPLSGRNGDSAPVPYAGPLAGMAAGLQHCDTAWLLCVPCDAPLLALDLCDRLASQAIAARADIVTARVPHSADDGRCMLRPEPVFCLIATHLRPSLLTYLAQGGRKVGDWTALHAHAWADFDRPDDDPLAFCNLNTLAELRQLEQAQQA